MGDLAGIDWIRALGANAADGATLPVNPISIPVLLQPDKPLTSPHHAHMPIEHQAEWSETVLETVLYMTPPEPSEFAQPRQWDGFAVVDLCETDRSA